MMTTAWSFTNNIDDRSGLVGIRFGKEYTAYRITGSDPATGNNDIFL